MGPPIAGWFIMENPIETGWWLGVPLFLWKPPFQQSYRMLQAPYPNGGNLKHCIAVASMCLSASAMASSSRCLQPFLVWNHMNSMFLPWTHGQIMNQHGSDHQQSTSIDASTSSFLASRPLTFGPCHVKWWSADQPCCRRIKHDGRSASPGILWKWDSRPYWAILGHTSNSTYPSYNHTWSFFHVLTNRRFFRVITRKIKNHPTKTMASKLGLNIFVHLSCGIPNQTSIGYDFDCWVYHVRHQK